MKLNLAPIRRIVEELTMRDTCLITVDPEETGDDVWDEETGTYVPQVGDRTTVYDGICSVYPFSGVVQEQEEGGEQMQVARYWLGVPVSEEFIAPIEALVEITDVDADHGDPELVGRLFVIDGQEWQTLASSRRIKMHELRPKP